MRSGSDASIVIMRVNGEDVLGTRTGGEEGAAVSAILMMEVGDSVDCIKQSDGDNLFDDENWKHNTLAGFLYTQL